MIEKDNLFFFLFLSFQAFRVCRLLDWGSVDLRAAGVLSFSLTALLATGHTAAATAAAVVVE